MSDYRTFLSDNLRRLRLACGYSQSNVAKALDMTRSNYSYYESGKTTPTLESLYKLSKIFGVTMEQIIVPEARLYPDIDFMRPEQLFSKEPQTIGELTSDEKDLIARLRSEKP